MRTSLRLVAALAIATWLPAFGACAAEPGFRIHYRLGGCFRTCPSYDIQVRGDGHVDFSGGDFLPPGDCRGLRQWRIDPAAVLDLAAAAGPPRRAGDPRRPLGGDSQYEEIAVERSGHRWRLGPGAGADRAAFTTLADAIRRDSGAATKCLTGDDTFHVDLAGRDQDRGAGWRSLSVRQDGVIFTTTRGQTCPSGRLSQPELSGLRAAIDRAGFWSLTASPPATPGDRLTITSRGVHKSVALSSGSAASRTARAIEVAVGARACDPGGRPGPASAASPVAAGGTQPVARWLLDQSGGWN